MKKLLIILFLLLAGPCYSATYYMANNPCSGNDGWGNGSDSYNMTQAQNKATPWLTLQHAMSTMSSGDTLIIDDGTYTGSSNAFAYGHLPPNGSSGTPDVYTTVRAENAGNVMFDGQGGSEAAMCYFYGPSSGNHARYIIIQGLSWHNTVGKVGWIVYCDHIKFLQCSWYDVVGTGYINNSCWVELSSYILFEDCRSWGNGNYNFVAYSSSSNIIYRRCVVRHDRYLLYDSQSSFFFYNCNGSILLQNCIDIDSDQYAYMTGPGGSYYPNYFIGLKGTSPQVTAQGCMAINHTGIVFTDASVDTNPSIAISNCSIWSNDALTGSGRVYGSKLALNTATIDHTLIGPINATGASYENWTRGIYFANTGYGTITNSILYGNANQTALMGGTSSDYNSFYANHANYSGVSAGTHDKSSENSNAIDPTDGTPGNGTIALKYPTRIESGSDFDGAASDSGDIGATIIYCYGKTGTLWGETDYNTLQDGQGGRGTEALWPFPYESTIKTAMQAWTASGQTGDRGFASSTDKQLNGTSDVTLTSYIWEYLGNQMPSDIYGESSTPTITGCVQSGGVTR